MLLIEFGFLGSEDPFQIEDPQKLQEISSAADNFSFEIFKAAVEAEENRFISPYSIHTALTMAYLGSEEETEEELGAVLGLSDYDSDKLREDILSLKKYLETSPGSRVSIANAFFLREGIPFTQGFREDGEIYFDAEVAELPETGEVINDWVYEKTEEKIEDLIDPGPIPNDVIAYLINAIYFQADWANEFNPEKTQRSQFYGPETVDVDMMEKEDDFRYLIDENLQAVTLEYEGNFLFHAIMPEEGLDSFYDDFDRQKLEEIKEGMNEGEIVLRIPKFTFEDELELKDYLEALGIRKAFNPGEARFSRMVDLERLDQNVYMSQVFHSSFIQVDEKGSEAAAATAVEMRLESMPMAIEFNRPFIFIIEEKETGSILFIGQLANPADL